MVQGFDSDAENFLHMVRKDVAISNDSGHVAADYISLIEKYESFGVDSSKGERISSSESALVKVRGLNFVFVF